MISGRERENAKLLTILIQLLVMEIAETVAAAAAAC